MDEPRQPRRAGRPRRRTARRQAGAAAGQGVAAGLDDLPAALGEQWPAVAALADVARRRGLAAYLVGGTVRDALLGRRARDVDVVVEGSAADLAAATVAAHGGAVGPTTAFGTTWWQPAGAERPIDIAAARAESYAAPAALPTVRWPATLAADLWRRDFSINAMAVPLAGAAHGPVALRDPCRGAADLAAGSLRILHGASFIDDPTRALRAVRLSARLRLRLAGPTARQLRAGIAADFLAPLSRPRLGAELDLLFAEPDPAACLARLVRWRLAPRLWPGWAPDARFRALLRAALAAGRAASNAWPTAPVDIGWALLSVALPPECRARCATWVAAGARRRAFLEAPGQLRVARAALVHGRSRGAAALALAPLTGAMLAVAAAHLRTPAARALLRWWRGGGHAVRTMVDGATLQARGYCPGPGFRAALAAALRAARDGGGAAAQHAAAAAVLGGNGST